MPKRNLLAAAAAAAILVGAAPALAQVSIMYNSDFAPLVESGIANFEAATGQKVNAIKLPGEGYQDRIGLDLAAGTAADLIMLDSFVVSEFAGSGYLEPLDTMTSGWDQIQYYMKGPLEVASYDGKLYALPTDTDVRMLWYNKSVLEKAGISLPWEPKNWAELLSAAAAIKSSGVDDAFVLPAGTNNGEGTTMQGFYMGLLGADTPEGDRNRLRDRASGKWIGDSPALRRTLKLFQDVYVNDPVTTLEVNYVLDFPGVNKALREGKIGIYANGSWENVCVWGCDGANLPSQEERDELIGWTPFPGSGEPGAKATTNISGGWTIAMSANAADKGAAFDLMTTIFDAKNFGDWTVANRRMTIRTDIANSDAYLQDTYLAKATELAADTTGRDTVPGYQKVSALVQQATGDILDGRSVDDTIKEYHDALVDEFGAENVMTLQ